MHAYKHITTSSVAYKSNHQPDQPSPIIKPCPLVTNPYFLSTSRNREFTTFLGLFQFLTILSVKKFLLICNLKLTWCNLATYTIAWETTMVSCHLRIETDIFLPVISFKRAVEIDEISPQPCFLQTELSQLLQPLLTSLAF